MNPGLVVKLRPTGPWRIGPDSGARNRVDFIYHSDSLYSAVTAAMGRMGSLEEWLAATARAGEPAVSFSSCFPFVDDIGFVVPPRTVWPPASHSAASSRVRWRSARFVPLEVVQSMLAGRSLDENKWSVDGPSECLVPAGRPGPFRTALRWSAAVDRLTGATERHSTACIEFRSGCGLWTIVSFRDVLTHARWMEPVKAAFRLLADSGFGGERSRGWGRAESPEFTEGDLPDMILPVAQASWPVSPESAEPVVEQPVSPEPTEPPVEQAVSPEPVEPPVEQASWPVSSEPAEPAEPSPTPPSEVNLASSAETAAIRASSSVAVLEMEEEETAVAEVPTEVEPVLATLAEEIIVVQPGSRAHWLLSLFTPSEEDSVDWRRGNYTVLARGGRVESAAGSGELKKQIQMVAEGSVLFAEAAPRGSAANVAPDGFAHPVYRAGFALSIPLPRGAMMRYRATCLTPLLVGDGRKLSPIDYMVWKDHVNVLDQWRIFRLLAKGPRLDSYLTQLKNAEKLDFASWGGFAQNFAGRRIPFENAAYSTYWNRAMGDSLHIPTFASGASGPYLPAAALKGAIRTGMVFANWRDGMLQDVLGRVKGDRVPRRPAEFVEDTALGSGGANKMRLLSAGDSGTVATKNFKIYLLRTSTIQPKGPAFTLGWKRSPSGTVDGARPDESTPSFAEMAAPGTIFEGDWQEKDFLLKPEVRRTLRWSEGFNRAKIFEAVNVYAGGLLSLQRQYASWAGMGLLDQNLDELEKRLAQAKETGACLFCVGWGGGLTTKSGWLDATNPDYRQILEQYQLYNRALATNLPFPKTRRIVFLNNRPATLPGWVELKIEE